MSGVQSLNKTRELLDGFGESTMILNDALGCSAH